MAITRSTDSGISQRTNVYAERQMLKWAAPVMVLDRFGLVKPLPKNKSTTIRFRRPRTFTAQTSPLLEGVTPTAIAFEYEDVSATLRQYGQVTELTDVIQDTHEDPVLNDVAIQAGENIGRTMEALTYGVLRAGTNVFYTNGSARTDVNTPLSISKIRAVVRSLKAQKAMPITQVSGPGPDYATRAVEPAYVAVAHTDLESDIRNLPGFLPAAQYARMSTVHEREIGTVENVRFVTSPDLESFADAGGAKGSMVSTTGTSADVYPVLVFGKEAYATVPLRGMGAVEPKILQPGQIDKSDPLGQRGTVGWKAYFAAVILNNAWMARLETAATAL